jgi:[ribosomal protein S18]-alanine N-acetyltransferase
MTYDHEILGMPPAAPVGRAGSAWVAITPVSLRDLHKVASLQKRAFRPPIAYGVMTLLLLWALPKVQFIIARREGRIVGCAIGDTQGGQSRVVSICVDPNMRRQGIAARLLRELETRLPTGDVVLMVENENSAAEALYRREGYLPVGVSRDYYGRGRDGIWMQKHRTPNPPPKIRV